MKALHKAMLIAFVVEAASAGTLAVGSFGPCGPGNPIGLIGMIFHLPGIAAWLALSTVVKLPETVGLGLVVVIQFLFWALLVVALQRTMRSAETRAG